MDFARKQLEKYGWKDGDGLGKESQGISLALKPSLKTGKEGMGFDLCKDLTDTWWTKAYSDSLSRIQVSAQEDGAVDVKVVEDCDGDGDGDKKAKKKKKKRPQSLYANGDEEERPMDKMRKRMMKANFTSFSKGGTLTNGEMVLEERDKPAEKEFEVQKVKVLTDDELLKACGGRTAHKAARFGLKLNGKLARIAAQEEGCTAFLSKTQPMDVRSSASSSNSMQDNSIVEEVIEEPTRERKKKKKKRDKKKSEVNGCES